MMLSMSLLLALSSFVHAQNPPTMNIVPRPASVRSLPGSFTLDDQTRLVAVDRESRRIAGLFNDFLLMQHGFRLQLTATQPKGKNYISFTQAESSGLPEEGYRVVVDRNRIRVHGKPAGLFYGMQTLTQLLPLENKPAIELSALEITDSPRFGYRGVLLDVGRHFFTVTYLKKYLDLMAQYKINTFHWHLTDDQGWRIEIKKYPKLTLRLRADDPDIIQNSWYTQDGTPYSPYYTQEQIKEIVAYAKARFITVVPEIEMPGHSGAAVAAYPDLACEPGPDNNVLCPKEETFTFIENVLNEVIALFPGPYVHVGGDEVQKDGWRKSATAQAIIKREGLKDEDQLQSYFMRRIEKFVTSKGKRMIGWDEILQGGLAPNAIVMSWRGERGGVEAVRQKHQAIMSPTDYCYLDYNQGDAKREPRGIGGFLPLEKVYSYDPIPKDLKIEEEKYILGGQANVWTEYIPTSEHLEYMVFPRLLALSEAVWSPAKEKDYANFQRRLLYQFGRLDKQNVHYRIPEPAGLKDFYTATDDHAVVNLTPPIPGSQIYYTLDGTTPTDQSSRYREPFQVPLEVNRKAVLNVLVVSPGERRSVVYGATFLRQSYREAQAFSGGQPGLTFTVFDGKFTSTQNIEQGTKAETGTANSIDLQQFGRKLTYGVTFDGYLKVPSDGFYQFEMESDDGSVLQIDDEVVVDNDGNHGSQTVAGQIPLRQGYHKLRVKYYQSEGGAALRVNWANSGSELKPLAGSDLFH
jgi:hexosaminidase